MTTEKEIVTIDQLDKAVDDLYRLVNQYMIEQGLKVSDSDKLKLLREYCYAIGDHFRSCHADLDVIRKLAFRNLRNLLICNNSRPLTPCNIGSILHIFTEDSEVGKKIARRAVADVKDSRIYLFDPTTDEIIDVTDNYRG